LKAIPDEAPRVLLATGRYIGEGFDDARLDTLFLTLPVSWRGTVQQYAGRLHRLHERKREVRIYDYVDAAVPMLARMHQKRLARLRRDRLLLNCRCRSGTQHLRCEYRKSAEVEVESDGHGLSAA